MDDEAYTDDVIYGGRLRMRQPALGYRINVDTVLLGAAAPTDAARVAEAGCGVGAALLIAATKAPGARLVGYERDAALAALAEANVRANGFAGRIEIRHADALSPPDEIFDAVLFNPPFAYPGEGRLPGPSKRAAHVADRPVSDWIKTWSNRLASGGSLTLIHRTDRLPEILAALENRLGAASIFPIRPRPGAAAGRVLVRARKGSRAPLRLLAGLDLHPPDGETKHTEAAEAILRGEAGIEWERG